MIKAEKNMTAACLLVGVLMLPSGVLAEPLRGETQSDLNESAGDQLSQAQQQLDRVIAEIQHHYQDKPLFLGKFEKAQAAWETFRDAELEAYYPPTEYGDTFESYGSMYPMCYAGKKQVLIEARIKQLEPWLQGTEEGDVCSGSVKLKDDLTPDGN